MQAEWSDDLANSVLRSRRTSVSEHAAEFVQQFGSHRRACALASTGPALTADVRGAVGMTDADGHLRRTRLRILLGSADHDGPLAVGALCGGRRQQFESSRLPPCRSTHRRRHPAASATAPRSGATKAPATAFGANCVWQSAAARPPPLPTSATAIVWPAASSLLRHTVLQGGRRVVRVDELAQVLVELLPQLLRVAHDPPVDRAAART